MAYKHIDPGVLLRAVGGDAAACLSLTLTYLDTAPGMHARLQQALQAGEPAAVAHAAHALKGSTTLVGAEQLTGLLQALERRARAGEGKALAAQGPELAELFQAALQEVLATLADGAER